MKSLGESHKIHPGAYEVTGAPYKGNEQTLSMLKEEKEDQMRCERAADFIIVLASVLGNTIMTQLLYPPLACF